MSLQDPVAVVQALVDRVWSAGDLSVVPTLVAPSYVIHRDPGDRWEGQTLDHATFCDRVTYCRTILEGLRFTVEDTIPQGDRVAIRWTYRGTQRGALPGLGVTGRAVAVTGLTIYAVAEGRVTGHWQETDQVGLLRQLGVPIPG